MSLMDSMHSVVDPTTVGISCSVFFPVLMSDVLQMMVGSAMYCCKRVHHSSYPSGMSDSKRLLSPGPVGLESCPSAED